MDLRCAAPSWLSIAGGYALAALGLRMPSRAGVLLALFAGVGALLLSQRGTPASPPYRPRRPRPIRRFAGRDLVEEASWESFPASDPPSY